MLFYRFRSNHLIQFSASFAENRGDVAGFCVPDDLLCGRSKRSSNICSSGSSMGVESGGTGGLVPRSRKISGGRAPISYDISVSFFLIHLQILHFPTFSK